MSVQVALLVVDTCVQLVIEHELPAVQVAHAEDALDEQSGSTAPQPQSQPSAPRYFVMPQFHRNGTSLGAQDPDDVVSVP
jgi:hypothetical protein